MFRKIVLAILSMGCLISASVFAVGLGEIKQSSGLNQPLNAEIPLLSAGDLAEYEVLATLASNREFEKVGVERLFFLNKIKFETVRDKNNQIVIKVSTYGPVKEPFLNFVVELNWPNGRILREYTLLLDPPVFEENSSATIQEAYTEPEPQAAVQPQHNLNTSAEPRAPRSGFETSENANQNYGGTSYGPVGNNDTLWGIASSVRPDRSVSIQQTLVAIYRANPHAFPDGNINNLRAGKVLEIPDANTIRNVPQRAALQDVVLQNREWRSGGARKIVSNNNQSSPSNSSSTGGSRLSLATENEGGNAQGYGSDTAELNDMKAKLSQSEEVSATLQAENEALRARLAEILAKVENAGGDSMVDVNDAELAALGQVSENNDGNEKPKLDNSSSLANSSETESAQENTTQSETNPSDISNAGSVNEQAETAQTNAGKETKPAAKIFKPESKEKGLLDQILENDMLLWGGAGTVVIIFLMLMFWRMKKRMEDDDFQDDLVASAGAGSMDTTETFELPDVGDDMLVELDMDDDEPDSIGKTDESFDPLGEADIYIAYGKHEQAESLLLDAIEDNPVRADFKVKLMECYVELDDQAKFESLATEVDESVDAEEWRDQVNNMRANTWGALESESEPQDDDDDFDLPSTEDIFGDEDDELDLDFDEEPNDEAEVEEAEFSLDTDIDESSSSSDTEILNTDDVLDQLDGAQEDDFSETPDFADLDSDDELTNDTNDQENLDDIEELEDLGDLDDIDGLDDLDDLGDLDDVEGLEEIEDIEEVEDIDKATEIENSADSLDSNLEDEGFMIDEAIDSLDTQNDDEFSLDDEDDSGEFSLDSEDDFGDDMADEGDEIATKLDLARAYVDMGDAEGAKEILEEVVAGGNDEQKAEAQALIDKSS